MKKFDEKYFHSDMGEINSCRSSELEIERLGEQCTKISCIRDSMSKDFVFWMEIKSWGKEVVRAKFTRFWRTLIYQFVNAQAERSFQDFWRINYVISKEFSLWFELFCTYNETSLRVQVRDLISLKVFWNWIWIDGRIL